MQIKRNKYGAPVGIVLFPEDALKLRRLRNKDEADKLPKKELKDAIAHFKETYPNKTVAKDLAQMEGLAAEEGDDLLGEDPSGEDEADELSIKDMRAALKEAGVTVSPNAKDETVQKRYGEMLEAD